MSKESTNQSLKDIVQEMEGDYNDSKNTHAVRSAGLLKKYLDKLKQIGEGSESYWKKRCEAAELNIETYCEWQDSGDGEPHMEDSEVYQKWQSALKAWQQLESSIGEETEGQDGWISVEDRLPELTGEYLVFETNHGLKAIEKMVFNLYNESWYNDNGDTFHPTHWQPLPKPPINTLIKK